MKQNQCKCGYLEIVKLGKKYIYGHNRRGKHHSNISKDKIRKARIKQAPTFLGHHHTEETKRKIGMIHKGKIVSEKTRKKISKSHKGNQYNKGQIHSEEHKRKISLALKGREFSEEHKRKLRNRKVSVELRERISQTLQGHIISKIVRSKIRKTLKERWKDPDFREKHLKIMFESFNKRPTKPERRLKNRLNYLFPNEYKYVGDGSFLIGYKNPDFMNINSQKKVIEMFGDYWHSRKHTGRTKKQEENQRIKYFAKYGYKTLIIWERELKNISKLKKKLVKFHNE